MGSELHSDSALNDELLGHIIYISQSILYNILLYNTSRKSMPASMHGCACIILITIHGHYTVIIIIIALYCSSGILNRKITVLFFANSYICITIVRPLDIYDMHACMYIYTNTVNCRDYKCFEQLNLHELTQLIFVLNGIL